MRERLRRLVLWAMMLALAVLLYIRSHGTEHKAGPVAFLRDHPVGIKVKITGNVLFPGIYLLPEESALETVIKMAVPSGEQKRVRGLSQGQELMSGDVLEMLRDSGQRIDVTVKKMPVNEKIILGIPLDINRMDAEDWDSLPGIGPVMALRILSDRQINGDYRSVSDLQRVPGTGKNKIKQLEKFFNKR